MLKHIQKISQGYLLVWQTYSIARWKIEVNSYTSHATYIISFARKNVPPCLRICFSKGRQSIFTHRLRNQKKIPGAGGYTIPTIYQILSWFDVDFKVGYDSLFYDNRKLNKEESVRVREMLNPIASIVGARIPASVVKTADCVMLVDTFIMKNNLTAAYAVSNAILLDSGFAPETCEISFDMRVEGKDVTGHAIMGFKCDDIYKVYDSATNTIFEFDWYSSTSKLSDLMQQLLSVWNDNDHSMFTYTEFFNPRICVVLYTNTRKRTEFVQNGSVCLMG